ncbi:hypothetical protein ACH4UR_10255 [Streptomyces lydicus]|uniref:hypothetical protein n=1 Tax=Streptomyces lydicus TaxID=47763 RepID=UPI0034040B17
MFWDIERLYVGEGASIGNVKQAVEGELRRQGYVNVRHNDLEVAGNKGGTIISTTFPTIGLSARIFYQMVIASGEDFEAPKATVGGMAAFIRDLRFL